MLKKLASLLLTIVALLALLSACATADGKHPLRYEPTTLPADHRPPPTGAEP